MDIFPEGICSQIKIIQIFRIHLEKYCTFSKFWEWPCILLFRWYFPAGKYHLNNKIQGHSQNFENVQYFSRWILNIWMILIWLQIPSGKMSIINEFIYKVTNPSVHPHNCDYNTKKYVNRMTELCVLCTITWNFKANEHI